MAVADRSTWDQSPSHPKPPGRGIDVHAPNPAERRRLPREAAAGDDPALGLNDQQRLALAFEAVASLRPLFDEPPQMVEPLILREKDETR